MGRPSHILLRMAEFSLPPLLAHRAEAKPPGNRLVLVLPAVLAIVGMMLAWAMVTYGQDNRREREWRQLKLNHYYWEAELRAAQMRGAPAEEIAQDQENLAKNAIPKDVISYARYGRQFTSWDGY